MAPIVSLIFLLFGAWFLRRQLAQTKAELQCEAANLRFEFELLRAEGIPSPPPNGFNLNRRPDTARRLRSGQSIDNIATATGWAVPEIVLLQKIEGILALK